MDTVFENDRFSVILNACKELYPDKKIKCFWTEYHMRNAMTDEPFYGDTSFNFETNESVVIISKYLSVKEAEEMLIKQLAYAVTEYDKLCELDEMSDEQIKELVSQAYENIRDKIK